MINALGELRYTCWKTEATPEVINNFYDRINNSMAKQGIVLGEGMLDVAVEPPTEDPQLTELTLTAPIVKNSDGHRGDVNIVEPATWASRP